MDAEIELKLFFLPENKNTLITEINHLFTGDFQADVVLSNGYFDTPDLQLRKWQMGLRVRGRNGEREQTIKTAGKVVGGIHSRPEYNVAINADTPTLALFPSHIWPQGADLAVTQSQLHCVFHTDFRRMTWHVTEGVSQIEIALDEGNILSGDKKEPLCELEFELLSGIPADLLSLAAKLVAKVPMRLGKASKAQRGYRLAGLSPKLPAQLASAPLADISAPFADVSAVGDLALAIETELERWQLIEDGLGQVCGEPLLAAPLWTALGTALTRLQTYCHQAGFVTHSIEAGFSDIKQQLDSMDALSLTDGLDTHASLLRLWHLPAYGQVQLALVDMLLNKRHLNL